MKHLLLVFLGGGTGSMLRYLLGKYLHSTSYTLPYGTLVVNVLGSFLIGLIFGWSVKNTNVAPQTIVLLASGFCGGFTTFSSFAYENYIFLRSGDFMSFGLYTLGSVGIGFLCVFLGVWVAK